MNSELCQFRFRDVNDFHERMQEAKYRIQQVLSDYKTLPEFSTIDGSTLAARNFASGRVR